MEDEFDLVTGLSMEEIDADHYLFQIDGVAKGNVDLNRWGWFSKALQTVAGVVDIWL